MTEQELEEKHGHLKDKFFGLYTGQPVAYYSDWLKEFVHYDPIEVIPLLGDDEESYLQLKPLSSISEEDSDLTGLDEFVLSTNPDLLAIEADYLRSKGYALPFMGIPVEHQIAMGWCKVGKMYT